MEKQDKQPLLTTGVPVTGAGVQDARFSGQFATGTPIYGGDAPPQLQQKFVTQGYKDVWAAGFFLLILLGTVVLAGVHHNDVHVSLKCETVQLSSHSQSSSNGGATTASHDNSGSASVELVNSCQLFKRGAEYMAGATGAAFVLCALAMIFMNVAPQAYIIMANVILIGMYVAIAGWEFYEGLTYPGVVFSFVAVIYALWFYLVRRRIPFAAALLSQSVSTVTSNWGTLVTSVFSLAVLVLYVVTWVVAVFPILINVYNSYNSATVPFIATCGFLLVFFWSTQVLINIVHVTASGTVATWYFAGGASMPSAPSVAALKRSMTTSFGSICLGSLVVAILKLIHAILRGTMRQRSCLACIAMCLIILVERLMQWFNVYAFTHVAIYGSSYVEAAKQTWDMIKNFGWAAIFNDNLVFPVLTLTTFFDSLAIAYVVWFIEGHTLAALLYALMAFIASYVVHVLLLRVVYSGVVTIFVCYVECPEALAVSNPAFNAKVDEAIEPLRRNVAVV